MVALAVAALAFSAAWVALLYSISWHAFAANSDDANVVLAGHSFVHGNPFLHGWQLPADPYWLTDVPVYGAFVAVTGLRASLMHAVPAALAASVVLVAVWLASRGAPRGGWTWTGGATTFVIIGLPVPLFRILLGQSLTFEIAHARRHLWQAEQVRASPEFPK